MPVELRYTFWRTLFADASIATSVSGKYVSSIIGMYLSWDMQYELVRATPTLAKQNDLLKSLALPAISRRTSPRGTTELAHLEQFIVYYQKKVPEGTTQTAKAVLKILGEALDQEGMHGVQDQSLDESPMCVIRFSFKLAS